MAKWLLIVESSCNDPTSEGEFKDWYEKTHFNDVLETPAFTKATLYELTQPVDGEGKFIATYEIVAEDIDTVMATHQDNMKSKREAGRLSNLGTVLSRGVYKQTSCLSK